MSRKRGRLESGWEGLRGWLLIGLSRGRGRWEQLTGWGSLSFLKFKGQQGLVGTHTPEESGGLR